MAAFSLNPAAGAHAELAALLIAKAYFTKRGQSTQPHDGYRSGYRARHESGVRRDGRLQGHLAQERRARPRQRRRDQEGARRRYRRLHDDESQHARAFRRSHRRNRRRRARRGRPDVLRRRERERAHGQRAAGRHGLRSHAPQHAQDVLRFRTAAAARATAPSALRHISCRSCRVPRVVRQGMRATRDVPARFRHARFDRHRCARSGRTSRTRCAR